MTIATDAIYVRDKVKLRKSMIPKKKLSFRLIEK